MRPPLPATGRPVGTWSCHLPSCESCSAGPSAPVAVAPLAVAHSTRRLGASCREGDQQADGDHLVAVNALAVGDLAQYLRTGRRCDYLRPQPLLRRLPGDAVTQAIDFHLRLHRSRHPIACGCRPCCTQCKKNTCGNGEKAPCAAHSLALKHVCRLYLLIAARRLTVCLSSTSG